MEPSAKSFARRYKYYEILEISKNATPEEIKKAFRRLAQKWHPDRNPGNSAAEAKFKKINEAFQVLSNPVERAAYDNSPAECPVCWTYKVIQISGNNWRCRRCACQFDTLGILLSETIERAAIPESYRVRLKAFQSMQCSWCKRFFTQPFLCPHRKLHSNCFFFDRLSDEERGNLLDSERWWWRIVDLVRQTESNGVIKKCVHCGVLNPNPEKLTCWNCGHSIYDQCPSCGLPTLYFDLDTKYWRCSNNYCAGKRFDFEKGRVRERVKPRPRVSIEKECPNCGHALYFDPVKRLWECRLGHAFTDAGLRKRQEEVSVGSESVRDETKGRGVWKRGLGWTLFVLGTIGLVFAIGLTLADHTILKSLPVLLIPAGLLTWSGWRLAHQK